MISRASVRSIITDSDSFGIQAGASASVLDSSVQNMTMNQTGLLAAIEVDLRSRVERCSIQSIGSVGGEYVALRAAAGSRVVGNVLTDLQATPAESFTAIAGQTNMTIADNEVRGIRGGAGTTVFGVVAGRNSSVTNNRLLEINGGIPHAIVLTSTIVGGTSDFGNVIARNEIAELVALATSEGDPGAAIECDLPALIEENRIDGVHYTAGLTGQIRNPAIRSTPAVVIARNTINNIRSYSNHEVIGRPFAAIEIMPEFGAFADGRPVITGNIISDILDAQNESAAIYTAARRATIEGNVISNCTYAFYLARLTSEIVASNLITNNRVSSVFYMNVYWSSTSSVTTDNTAFTFVALSMALRGVQITDNIEEGNRAYED
jgi:hypothetical protein